VEGAADAVIFSHQIVIDIRYIDWALPRTPHVIPKEDCAATQEHCYTP